MTGVVQAYLLALLGTFVLRLGVTDAHLLYVRGWTRWPLIATGLVLLLLCAMLLLEEHRAGRREDPGIAHEHHTSWTTWLLFAPVLVMMLISPPALGSYLAERSADSSSSGPRDPEAAVSALRPLPPGDPVRMHVIDFYVRARYDEGLSLVGRTAELTGFVSLDRDGNWYVTRFEIGCCAADAVVVRVRVDDAPAPDRDQWVTVTGSWVDGSGFGGNGPPAITADRVEPTEQPSNPYE